MYKWVKNVKSYTLLKCVRLARSVHLLTKIMTKPTFVMNDISVACLREVCECCLG